MSDGKKTRCARGFMTGRRDAFKKSYRFTSALGDFFHHATKYASKPLGYVSFPVVVSDCGTPVVVARVGYGADSWVFVNSFSILADGEVALEKKYDFTSVERDIVGRGVHEVGSAALSSAEVEGLLRASDAGTLLVRVTGQKGYVMLDARQLEGLRQDLRDVRHVLARIGEHSDRLAGRSCARDR